jgi:hypothetical protein
MADAKVQIKLGAIEFSGEGEENWVATQLDKILAQAADLLKIAPDVHAQGGGGTDYKGSHDEEPALGTDVPLGTFLKNKAVGNSQVNRFLATAIWLVGRGNKTPSTSDVNKALKDSQQPKLSNAADCLNKNVTKGLCEKQGKQFYVTPDGFASMKQ